MRRNEFLKLSFWAGTAAMLGGCSRPGSSEAPVQYFRYAENQAEDYPTAQAAYRFADLVNQRTGGRIQIQVYPGAALGDEASVVEQMQLGMIDFARVSLGTLSEYCPMLNVLQMPYLYVDSDQMWRVLDGEIGGRFLEGLPDIDLYGLSWFDAGARSFYSSKRPIQTLEDLQGLIVRVQEASLISDMVLALGAAPVTMVYADVYAGLQSGDIDAAENNIPSYDSMKHYEVAKYFSEDRHLRIPELQIVSKAVMDRLAPEDQAVVRQAALESAEYERQLWATRETESRARVLEAGAQINQLAPEELARLREAVAPLYDQYCAGYADLVDAIRTS